VVALGAGVALAIALPAALLAQVLDALSDDDDGGGVATYVLAVVVLAGTAIGGGIAGRFSGSGRRAPAALLGAGAALVAIALVLALGVTRRLVAGEDVAWATVPATALVAVVLGATAAALKARPTARTRP
jgi:hypothetical protein